MAKKCTSILLVIFAIILAGIFALLPFLEHKINWDCVAAKTALVAAKSGYIDIAQNISNDVKYKPFLKKANAHIALQKLKSEGEDSVKDFIKSCGKNFDFEEYIARKMIDEIQSEPNFAAGLLRIKYINQIESLKNPFLKALIFYNLSLKAKPTDDDIFTYEVSYILKNQPVSEELTTTCIEISKLAFNGNRPEDFFKFLKIIPQNPHFFTNLFLSLKKKSFRQFIFNNNRYDWSYRGLITRNEMLSGKQISPLEFGKQLKYSLTKSDFNGITADYKQFNLPIIAYVAFISQKDELFNEYKKYCIAPETIRAIKGSKFGYLRNSAIFFEASNEQDYAFNFVKLAENKHQKLRILNAITLQLPPDKKSIQAFYNLLKELE